MHNSVKSINLLMFNCVIVSPFFTSHTASGSQNDSATQLFFAALTHEAKTRHATLFQQ